MSGSDPGKLIYKADNLTTLSLTRWSADWESATRLYEQAANGFRVSKDYENAKSAFEKASKGREMLSSKASELYMQCDRPQYASDSLAKAARTGTRGDACVLLEDDRKEQMALDLYHAVTNIYVKLEKYTDAVAFLLKLGLAADKCNATNSQCKAYLSAVIVYLYAHDLKQAEKCYNDCSQIDAFLRSDQNRFAGKLLSAYREGDVEEIKRVSQSRSITNLDSVPMAGKALKKKHVVVLRVLNLSSVSGNGDWGNFYIIKLARKLPTGDVAAFKTNAAIGEGEALDENDLT
ncbi:hypothetical protein GOBAR_AA13013 [Gossypium barbadense]|uniref:Gamma-soluble NSF attachment protein n=1 Tax=Gossypium barbadense TaxID=3634 RepID=A0A2P5XWC1_GOSBA|nr:hypothetical protein GOBAR_AA13013 [Gossypium barbadense]